MASRINLQVPFAEKDEAKRLGARWDPRGKIWYVPDGADATPLQKWVPAPQTPNVRAASWYLATATRECWRCHEISQVFGMVLPEGHQILMVEEDPEDDFWQVCWLPTLLNYITDVSEYVAWHLQKTAPRYRIDYSQTTHAFYWMNHCEHCEAKLGNFETFEEPGQGFGASENIRLVEILEPFTGACGGYTQEDIELLAVVNRFRGTIERERDSGMTHPEADR